MSLEIKWRAGIAQIHGTVAGQRVRESARTRDPDSAERARAEREARLLKAALYGAENEATFADAALLYLAEEHNKPRRYIRRIVAELGKRRLATIKPGDLKDLAKKLYPNAKNATLNRSVIKPARAIINFAHERGLCHPIMVKGFYEALVERPAGDWDWIDQFRASATDPRVSVLALFMFVTAARISECLALEPKHMDLQAKTATLPTSKNGDPRVYYLTDELVEELRKLPPRATHYGRGPLKVFGWAGHQGPDKAWRATCARAGIPYLSPHEAGRHGFGTETVVRKGIDVVTAARLGGWKDPTVLVRRYVHARELGAKAEAILGREKTASNGTPLTHRSGRRAQDVDVAA
jgi:integrase